MHGSGDSTSFNQSIEDKVSLMLQMINKLLYRSRQRGFLELDLLVGLWAEQEVPKMDTHMLQQFTVVLDQVSSCKRPAASRKGAERCWKGAVDGPVVCLNAGKP